MERIRQAKAEIGTAITLLRDVPNSLISQIVDDLVSIHEELQSFVNDTSATPMPSGSPVAGLSESKCRDCNQKIFWGPNPSNPDRKLPFNEDGTVHFSTCPEKKKQGTAFESKADLRAFLIKKGVTPPCINNFHVHWATMSDGRDFLRVTCNCHGRGLSIISQTKENVDLVEKPRDWHKSHFKRGW